MSESLILNEAGNKIYDEASPSTHAFFGRHCWRVNDAVYARGIRTTVVYIDGKAVILQNAKAFDATKFRPKGKLVIRGHRFHIVAVNGEYITLRGI